MRNLGLEDLASNAFIEVIQRDGVAHRFLAYADIENYGTQVVDILREQGQECYLTLSRDYTYSVLDKYSEFFEEVNINGKEGIVLKQGVTVEQLRWKFRGYLALDVLLALCDTRAINILPKI